MPKCSVKDKTCEFKDCKTRPSFNLEGEIKARFCSKHKEINMVNVNNKTCEFKGCKKQPNYNLEGEVKARFCNEHKEINMIDIKNKTCEFKGCKTLPTFNLEGEIKARFCSKHKEINMVNVKDKTCEFKDCKTRPSYNLEGEVKARFCSEHKELNMIDIKHKTCEFQGCKKQPHFNFEGEIKARFCNEHKEINMVDVRSKTCEFQGCKKGPTFNLEGEIKARFCSKHKEVNMVNVKDKKCEFKDCKKQPNFNLEGEIKARFCNEHKEINMVNVKSKTCEFKGCKTLPNFNLEGEIKARFCNKHKEVNMVNVKHKTCIVCKKTLSSFGLPGTSETHCAKHKLSGMIRQPNKRCISEDECKEPETHGINEPLFCEEHALKEHYNLCERKCTNKECLYPEQLDILNKEGLCVTFCSLIKQDQMMKKHMKKKEMFIGNLLKEEIKQDLSYQDEVVDSSCSKVRPDFVYDCCSHIVIIEVDENQHKSYSNCGSTKEEKQFMENKRMFMIYQSFGGPNVIFIRYNPDSFRVKDKVLKVNDNKRHECLLLWVKHFLKNKSEIPLEVKYLFYDEYDEREQTKISIEEKDVL